VLGFGIAGPEHVRLAPRPRVRRDLRLRHHRAGGGQSRREAEAVRAFVETMTAATRLTACG